MICSKQHHYGHYSNTAQLAAIVRSHGSFERRCQMWVYYLELRHSSIKSTSTFIIPVTVTTGTKLPKRVAKGTYST
jgi:hypothetical protein